MYIRLDLSNFDNYNFLIIISFISYIKHNMIVDYHLRNLSFYFQFTNIKMFEKIISLTIYSKNGSYRFLVLEK